jgi:hypothetical protein
MGLDEEFVPCLDGCQLADICQHVICAERSALHVDTVPAIYSDGGGGEAKLAASYLIYLLVDLVSWTVQYAVREGTLGLLNGKDHTP